jgi:mono/diheme cytochrome c family protein
VRADVAGIRGGLCLALGVLAIVPVAGCGSSDTQAVKQARIQTALRHLEHEFLAAQKEASNRKERQRQSGDGEVLGAATMVYAPAPHGVSKAEWNAAIKHDPRLQALFKETRPAVGSPGEIELQTPPAVLHAGGRTLTAYQAGKRAVAQSGCLACHRIGETGNPGPGPDLTEVAGRLPRQAIARTLVAPVAPMPSFKNLPPAKFRAIVVFLSELK